MPNRRSLRILTYSRRYTPLESIGGQRFPDAADRVGRGRASSIISRHSRAMLQVGDHQAMSQGSKLWPSEVNMWPLDAVARVHRGHAAISSLLGSREGRQDLIHSQTHERRPINHFA